MANHTQVFLLEKDSAFEVCPKCAQPTTCVYDRVTVSVQDAPLRNKNVILKIRKRRFRCKECRAVFREPVPGIVKGFRTTQRFRKHLMWQSSQFSNLNRVSKLNRCSDWLVYKAYYQQIRLKVKEYDTPWPKTVGIDEHSFIRNRFGRKEFTTIFVDYNRGRVREAVYGRSPPELMEAQQLHQIEGRENVKNVIMDLSSGFRSFARQMFPNARITADKFHVIKLLFPALQKYKKEVIGNSRKNPFKKMLLKDGKRLLPHERNVLKAILHFYPALKDLYTAKEAIHSLYRIKGYNRAREALVRLTDWLAYSKLPELQTLRKTLLNWKEEILNYFRTQITNGRTEGYNRKAKLIQRNAYGFKNFENYRLKLLYTCR